MDDAFTKIQSDSYTKELYKKLIEQLNLLGKFYVERKKTSLHISHGRAFLGIHPRSNGLLINIVLDSKIDNPRIKKVDQVSKNRFHNEILVNQISEIDPMLINWIKKAYELTL